MRFATQVMLTRLASAYRPLFLPYHLFSANFEPSTIWTHGNGRLFDEHNRKLLSTGKLVFLMFVMWSSHGHNCNAKWSRCTFAVKITSVGDMPLHPVTISDSSACPKIKASSHIWYDMICVFKSCYRGSRPIVTYTTEYMYIYKKQEIDNLTSKGGKREKLYTTKTGQDWVKVEREGESKGEE